MQPIWECWIWDWILEQKQWNVLLFFCHDLGILSLNRSSLMSWHIWKKIPQQGFFCQSQVVGSSSTYLPQKYMDVILSVSPVLTRIRENIIRLSQCQCAIFPLGTTLFLPADMRCYWGIFCFRFRGSHFFLAQYEDTLYFSCNYPTC